MQRALTAIPATFLLFACCAAAQTPSGAPAPAETLHVQSQLVLVPTSVETKKGDIIFELKASQFEVKDNGVLQLVRLEDSNDGARLLSLVVVDQCSRSAYRQQFNTGGLPTMVDALIGGAPAEVAVVRFGSGSQLISGFSTSPRVRNEALSRLQPCDDTGDTIFDAVDYANTLLDAHRAKGRRTVLLISETRDHGSDTKPDVVVRELSRSNTVLDAVAFLPGRTELGDELKNPGSGGGLLPLLFMSAEAARKNAPKEFARLTGGLYFNFTSQRAFDRSMTTLANRVHNYYLLTFQPRFPSDAAGIKAAAPGLHTLTVRVLDYPSAIVRHRESYWLDKPSP